MKEVLSTIFARASRLFDGAVKIAGGNEAVINEQSKVGVYLPKEYGVESTVFNVESLMEWFKSYDMTPSVAFVDMVDLINGSVDYTCLANLQVLASDKAGEQQKASLIFRVSKELDDWRRYFGYKFSPQEFRRFLQNRREEFNDSECSLFESMCNLNMSVNREYELEDDGGVDRKIHFQVKKGSDFTHLPRVFNLEVPMLFGDDGTYSIPVELEFNLPTEHNNNRPSFVMKCEFLDRLMIERVKTCVEDFEEAAKIKAILGFGKTVDLTPAYKKVIGG